MFFPAPPYIKRSMLIPLDAEMHPIKDDDTETPVFYDVVPHWWLIMVADYMSQTEVSVSALDDAGFDVR